MGVNDAHEFKRRGIPDLDSAVGAPREEEATIRTVTQPVDMTRIIPNEMDFLPGAGVPDRNDFFIIDVRRRDAAPIGTVGKTIDEADLFFVFDSTEVDLILRVPNLNNTESLAALNGSKISGKRLADAMDFPSGL